jgi:hypothetical protein
LHHPLLHAIVRDVSPIKIFDEFSTNDSSLHWTLSGSVYAVVYTLLIPNCCAYYLWSKSNLTKFDQVHGKNY